MQYMPYADPMRTARTIRNAKGLTLYQVAHATGLEQATINRLETGVVAAPTYHTLCTLADFYEVTIDELLADAPATEVPAVTVPNPVPEVFR
jgi:transcriptional regulator with XRE-family HTH domain